MTPAANPPPKRTHATTADANASPRRRSRGDALGICESSLSGARKVFLLVSDLRIGRNPTRKEEKRAQ